MIYDEQPSPNQVQIAENVQKVANFLELADFAGPYAEMPNEVALDENLDFIALGILAIRATFTGKYALNKTSCALGIKLSNGRRGFTVSEKVFGRAIRTLKRTPWFSRWQDKPKPGSGRRGYARELVSLPDCETGYRVVHQEWAEHLTARQLGMLVWVRAQLFVYPRGVVEKSGLSRQTVMKDLRHLEALGFLVCQHPLDPRTNRPGKAVFSCAEAHKTGVSEGIKISLAEKRRTHLINNSHETYQYADAESATGCRSDLVEIDDYVDDDDVSSLNLPEGHDDAYSDLDADDREALQTEFTRRQLKRLVFVATKGRISRRVLADAPGAVVALAAVVMFDSENSMTPEECILRVIAELDKAVGQKGRWLNSWTLVSKRLVNQASEIGFDPEFDWPWWEVFGREQPEIAPEPDWDESAAFYIASNEIAVHRDPPPF